MRIAVLTISDAGARGERADTSGDDIVEWARERGYDLSDRALVPDEAVEITGVLVRWCDDDVADVVLTTGGTGLSARDVTPEATRAAIEREAPGIAEAMRGAAVARVPNAMISRGIAGTRARTLIVNLPGSPSGVRDGLDVVGRVVDHAVDVLRGRPASH